MRVLVVANGDAEGGPPPLVFDRIVAADGGARLCRAAGLRPNLVVGDLDSLPEADCRLLAAEGAAFRVHPDPVRKEETDLELALAAAMSMRPDEIVLWGIWGGRPDHALANVLALTHPILRRTPTRAYASGWWMQLVRPGVPLPLTGNAGATVSLLPLSPRVTGIVTTGLRYPLPAAWERSGGTLPRGSGRGVSNIMNSSDATVRIARGLLLVINQATAHVSDPVGGSK